MNLKMPLTNDVMNTLNITAYDYAVSFDVFAEKYVNGLLVVDDFNIYILIDDKLYKKYKIKDFNLFKINGLRNIFKLYAINSNKQELLIEFSYKYYSLIASLALTLNEFLQKHQKIKDNDLMDNKNKKNKPIVNYFVPYLNKYKYLIFLYLLVMCIAIFVDTLKPNLLQSIVNDYLLTKTFNTSFMIMILILGMLYLLKTISSIAKGIINPRISYGIIHDLRVDIYNKVQTLSLKSANKKTTGSLINMISNDTSTIANVLSNHLITFISSCVEIVVLLILMFINNYKLALYIVIPLPFIVLLSRYIIRLINIKYEKRWKHLTNTNDTLHDIINGIKVVKSYGMEQKEIERFKKSNIKLMSIDIDTEKFWSTFTPVLDFLFGLIQVLIYYYVGKEVLQETMKLGDMLKWATYSSMLLSCASTIASFRKKYQQMSISASKIKNLLQESYINGDKEILKENVQGKITFDDVSFGYESYKYVLHNISFTVKPGQTIGIVGHSGAGKSTLINLLTKLYLPNYGKILLDDQDICTLNDDNYRKLFGVVLQETYLFSGTIYDNIVYGNDAATYDEVIHVCKLCNAHDFIIKKPFGYETRIGKNGEGLSGGQKQRIAIARAILTNPKIFIFDEATSSLDTLNERQIQDAIARISQNITTFIIAHRLSTLKNADKLIVLKNGKMVEFGSHQELILKKGYYYSLIQAQSMNYEKK